MGDKAYLLVHYKGPERRVDEQVHFAVSKDGYKWEEVNGGNPVFMAEKSETGVRDIAIIRTNDNKFVILGNDLSMAVNFEKKYDRKWPNMGRYGSQYINLFRSDDLVNWGEQELIALGDENFGCFWGPNAMYVEEKGKYVVYWSSSNASNDYVAKMIYYAETDDFKTFSEPKFLCKKDDASVVDPHIRKIDGKWYRFLKSRVNPFATILEVGDSFDGEYKRVEGFDEWMSTMRAGAFEASTMYQAADGKWILLLDYFEDDRAYKGYNAFEAVDLENGKFADASDKVSFPYGMKHGNVLEITMEEYNRIKDHWK